MRPDITAVTANSWSARKCCTRPVSAQPAPPCGPVGAPDRPGRGGEPGERGSRAPVGARPPAPTLGATGRDEFAPGARECARSPGRDGAGRGGLPGVECGVRCRVGRRARCADRAGDGRGRGDHGRIPRGECGARCSRPLSSAGEIRRGHSPSPPAPQQRSRLSGTTVASGRRALRIDGHADLTTRRSGRPGGLWWAYSGPSNPELSRYRPFLTP